MNFIRKLSLCLLLALLGYASPAAAHRPDWGGSETHIADIQVSHAFYRELTASGQVDRFTFQAQAGEFLHAGIQIPKVRGMEAFGVSMALFGPGLPPAAETAHEALPDEHPEGGGVLLLPNAEGDDYYEPFTQTAYYGRQEINMELAEAGDYTLLVWHPDGELGKYVLDVGRREQFSLPDALRFPIWWVQARLYFEQAWILILLAGVVLLAGVGVWFRRSAAAQARARL